MVEQIAKIRKVRLGWEDHDTLTCMVDLDYGDSVQSAGGCSLDEPLYDDDDKFIGRRGSAYGMEWIARLMRAAGVEDFAMIEGRTVLAIQEDGFHGRVLGLKPLPTELGETFMFAELAIEDQLRREVLRELVDEAAQAVCEPRRFHENENGRQQALGVAVAKARLEARP